MWEGAVGESHRLASRERQRARSKPAGPGVGWLCAFIVRAKCPAIALDKSIPASQHLMELPRKFQVRKDMPQTVRGVIWRIGANWADVQFQLYRLLHCFCLYSEVY